MKRNGVFASCLAFLALVPLGVLAQAPQPVGTPAATEPLVEPALPADAEFARNIAFIRADLLIADALVKDRDWVDARPHVNFPREEVYGAIRDELRIYKTPPFDGALRDLAHAVAARSIKSYDRARKKMQAALVAAEFGLRARQKDWPRFALQVAAATLREAADEYGDAVARGRIVHPVGYQSARGIVFETDRMVESAATELAPRNVEKLQGLRGNMIHLKDTFAPVAAPKEPRADPEAVRQLIDQTTELMRALE
jgi:hypothetical protein